MITVDTTLCTGCKRCQRACPHSAIQVNPIRKKAEINQTFCNGCGICIEECPANALAFSSTQPWEKHIANDFAQRPSTNVYTTIASKNYPVSQFLEKSAYGRGKQFGRNRHCRKNHGRGWFHKNNR